MPIYEPGIPRSTGPDGYTVGAPANTVPFDGGYKYTGSGFPASNDNYIMPEWRMASPQRLDAALTDNDVAPTIMRFRHADGHPYRIPVTSENLPPGFPLEYADLDGLLPSDWKLIVDPDNSELVKWVPWP